VQDGCSGGPVPAVGCLITVTFREPTQVSQAQAVLRVVATVGAWFVPLKQAWLVCAVQRMTNPMGSVASVNVSGVLTLSRTGCWLCFVNSGRGGSRARRPPNRRAILIPDLSPRADSLQGASRC
jgi:hypothetical protein